MIDNFIHKLVTYSFVATIVIAVWTSAWARAISVEADRGWWPPLPVPQVTYHAASQAVAVQ
jgi:hypothetical protein